MSEENEQECDNAAVTVAINSKDAPTDHAKAVAPKKRVVRLWAKLSDPQATIIAALITSIISLVVSFVLAVFTSQQARKLEDLKTNQSTTLEAFKSDLIAIQQRQSALNVSRGEALKYIHQMKETIDEVLSDRATPFGSAKALLGTAAYNLRQAYADGIKPLVSSVPEQETFRKRFHAAKNLGLKVLRDFNQTKQEDNEPVPDGLIPLLEGARRDLDSVEVEIQKDAVKAK